MTTVQSYIIDLLRRVAELERRSDGMVKQGAVTDVDPAKGLVRVRLNPDDADEPFKTAWIPYAQIAGALKAHTPPSVGQQMTIISGAGDYRQGLAVPMTWSDKNKSPSEKGDENVITYGDARIELRGDELVITIPKVKIVCGGVTVEITDDGVKIEGGKVTHDGKNIGSTHIHGGVVPGGGTSDVPAN